jgi:hypothetical protein
MMRWWSLSINHSGASKERTLINTSWYKAFEQYSGEGVGNINFVVKHCDSKNEPCIQAADFFAGAVHRGYREGDFSCYELIERRIILEYDYFEGPKK